jgi:hypothetical protein
MNNFPEPNLENMGGYSRFNFIPNYQVESFSPTANTINTALVLKSGAVWFIGAAVFKSLSLEEKTVATAAGDLYKYEFSGVYPGQSAPISELFDEMKAQPLVIDVEDNNGQRRLLGNTKNPCKFSFAFKSKETPSGRPEYTFSFTWESPKPAPFYAP